jgi:hypothetical protein
MTGGYCESISGENPTNGPICLMSDRTFPSRVVQNNHEPAAVQGKIMNPHNTKTESVIGHGSVRTRSDREAVRVTKSQLIGAVDLSISEDCDPGSDPYNSTGQHVIIKPKVDLQD